MSRTATESAVIVAVPAAEVAVAPWRTRLDPSAPLGVPAHITVLYPFLPPAQIDDAVLAEVGDAARGVAAFDVTLATVKWFDDAVVWLAPEPAEPFRMLTRAVWDRFPETPPYGGEYPDLRPHLTIGEGARPAEMRQAEAAIAPLLPIRQAVRAVHVICGSRDPSSWRTIATLPLSPRT